MAPKHPVPEGYGHPCDQGEFIPQGTSSGIVPYAYDSINDIEQDEFRGVRSVDNNNMFDDC